MGTDDGTAGSSLTAQLEEEPYRFDFYQAVRLVEMCRPRAVPLGHMGGPRESIAFSSQVGLGFAASDLVGIKFPADARKRVEMSVAFMGLAGTGGPLPVSFTEMILRRVAIRDYAARDFLDIFSHRLISFLYRSRKKYRVGLSSEAPETSSVSRRLYEIAGLRQAASNRNSRTWARSLLQYAGILSVNTRSMAGLEAMLSHFFRIPVRGLQLQGRWLQMDAGAQTRIGLRTGTNQRLGESAVLGVRAWDQMGAIRLSLHDLTLARLRRFLPIGEEFLELTRLVRIYLKQDLEVEVDLHLRREEQGGGTRLSRSSESRLGWTSWLSSRPARNELDPVRLRLPRQYGSAASPTGTA